MLVNRVHSKIVIGDEGLLCIGSFNWFSATRDEKYKRYDTSMVYRGESLQAEIKRFIPAWNSGSYRDLKAMQVSNVLN
jgi:phosphatidylserine/phosphatidylglycerophosphate/cardiolipin synthase-like enzyme